MIGIDDMQVAGQGMGTFVSHWHAKDITVVDESRNEPVCGGNKIRKLNRFLATRSPTGILAFGSEYSSLCLAAAYWGAKNGVPVRLLIISADSTALVSGRFPHVRLARQLGAKIGLVHPAEARERIDQEQELRPTYTLIPAGGHSVEGLEAYRDWFLQLLAAYPHLREREWIALPFGTGTTALGILAAIEHEHLNMRVIGVSVSRSKEQCLDVSSSMVGAGALGRLEIDARFAGRYGVMEPHHHELRARFMREAGILPDPIYNVRVAEVVESQGLRGGIILNTGGQWNHCLPDLDLQAVSNTEPAG